MTTVATVPDVSGGLKRSVWESEVRIAAVCRAPPVAQVAGVELAVATSRGGANLRGHQHRKAWMYWATSGACGRLYQYWEA